MTDLPLAPDTKIQEPRLWQEGDWCARVIKNEDDDGWAVAMTFQHASEPALVGPWTMGRNKKDPKPLDSTAFRTLVKTASEFVRRQEQQSHAALHQSITVHSGEQAITVFLDITPDDDNPSARLRAEDDCGQLLADIRVPPHFQLKRSSALQWVDGGFAKPTR